MFERTKSKAAIVGWLTLALLFSLTGCSREGGTVEPKVADPNAQKLQPVNPGPNPGEKNGKGASEMKTGAR